MAARGRMAIAKWLWIAAAIVVLDQATKYTIERLFSYGERLVVVPGFFDLTLVYNRGAAFSFLAHADGWQRWFFIGIGAAATIFIVWLLTKHGSQRLFAFSLALILGGAIGNVVDRIVRGHVVDFVLLHWQRFHWPAFNVADSAITVGAVLLVVDELRRVRRNR